MAVLFCWARNSAHTSLAWAGSNMPTTLGVKANAGDQQVVGLWHAYIHVYMCHASHVYVVYIWRHRGSLLHMFCNWQRPLWLKCLTSPLLSCYVYAQESIALPMCHDYTLVTCHALTLYRHELVLRCPQGARSDVSERTRRTYRCSVCEMYMCHDYTLVFCHALNSLWKHLVLPSSIPKQQSIHF